MSDAAALRSRLDGVRERIARSAGRAGRDPSTIRLVAVSKTFPADDIRAAFDAGLREFGENRVQEALPKMAALADLPIRWHLIGHLQSNKARKAAESFALIHSVDDEGLLRKIDQAAEAAGRRVEALVQVDLAGEATKHGARPELLRRILAEARECRGVSVSGLMLLPPAFLDPEESRPYFAGLRRLRDELVAEGAHGALPELSMGMSHDFEIAVEEGATLVRIGSALFGDRPPHQWI